MNKAEILGLALRVEALEGADREVDGDIDRMIHARPKHGDYDEIEKALWPVSDGYSGLLVRSSDGCARDSFCASRYTASLDAAMGLVPEGWGTLSAEQSHDGAEWIWRLYPAYLSDQQVFGQACAAATALTAAALRAIASTMEDDRG